VGQRARAAEKWRSERGSAKVGESFVGGGPEHDEAVADDSGGRVRVSVSAPGQNGKERGGTPLPVEGEGKEVSAGWRGEEGGVEEEGRRREGYERRGEREYARS
jgi:hypothetical protein